jgi:hypothetical protein
LFTDAVLRHSGERYKADRSFPLKTAQADPHIQKTHRPTPAAHLFHFQHRRCFLKNPPIPHEALHKKTRRPGTPSRE